MGKSIAGLGLAVVAALVCGAEAAGEETAPPIERNRFTVAAAATPVVVDGRLDEPAWAAATRVPLTHEWFPGDNTPPPVGTECLVTFDAEQIYVAFRASDPAPGRIRAYFADRDIAFADDTVGFLIDTFNDRRRAFQFRVNPLGVQMDSTVSDPARQEDWTWDAIWDSAGRVTTDGYEVEIAVPFKQLRFPAGAGAQTWGFLATRDYPRDVNHELRSTPNDRSQDCKVCQFDTLSGFEGMDTGHNVQAVPTVTGSRTDARANLTAPLQSGDEDAEGGFSVRWSATPNTALNATLNPDFSHVEADSVQLDVNERFTLNFPEKRPFFLEGADFYRTLLNAVFTRTVADPDGGLKLTGKQGKTAFGLFGARDRLNNLVFPGVEEDSNDSFDQEVTSGVLRVRRDVGATSTLGVLYTGRDADGYSNHVYGVDGSLRLTPSNTVRFQVLESATDYPAAIALDNDQPLDRFGGTAWRADYLHGSRNWLFQGIFSALDEGFRADSGFITQVGIQSGLVIGQRIFWGSPERWFRRFIVQIDSNRIEERGGRLLEESANLVLIYQGPMQSTIQVGIRPNNESFRGVYMYNFRRDLTANFRPFRDVELELFLRGGEQVDFTNVRQADFETVRPRVEFQLGRRFTGELQHTYQTFHHHGVKYIEVNLTQTSLRYHFNRRSFLRAILQYRDVERDLSQFPPRTTLRPKDESLVTQFLFSYKVNPETLLLVGYADNHAGTHLVDLTQRDRTFFVKVGYAVLW
jgi:hypothetical protein